MTNKITNDAGAALAAQAIRLKDIRLIVEDADTRLKGHHGRLYAALAGVYALTLDLVESTLLVFFVEANGGKWTKVAASNPFQPVVGLAFKGTAMAPSISKYAAVLQYAHQNSVGPKEIENWLSEGIEKILERARGSSTYDTYDETPQERLDRALSVLSTPIARAQAVAATSIPAISGVPPEAAIADFRKALVRVVDGKLEVLKILPTTAEELKQEILAVAPKDPSLGKRKLAAKAYYDVFRACDLMNRFARAADQSDEASPTYAVPKKGKVDVATWKQSIDQRSNKAKAAPTTSLRIKCDAGEWWAETVSTKPTFPVIRMKLQSDLSQLDTAKTYVISKHQAKRVVTYFVGNAEWTLRARQLSTSGHDAAGDTEIVLDELDTKLAWHQPAQLGATACSFTLQPDTFVSISSWSKRLKVENGKVLPSQLSLEMTKSDLRVLPAGETDTKLGLPLTPLKPDAELAKTLTTRWLLRDDLLELASIHGDYGQPMAAKIVHGNEPLAALQVEHGDATIVVPLLVSLAGDYAEIVEPV